MNEIVEELNRAAAVWWDWTVASTGQGALLLLLVVAILAAGRSLRPGLRYGLLLVVLLKFAVPPVYGVAYGFSDLLGRVFNDTTPQVAAPEVRVTLERAPVPAAVSTTAVEVPARPPVLSQPAWLLLLEVSGALVVIALIARQLRAAKRVQRAGATGDDSLQRRFQVLARAIGIRRAPRLYVSGQANAPQAGGVLRPYVVLPVWADTMPEEELDILLAHELAHVRRKDALVNALQALVQALLWWNPAVWWLNRRIREEREFCCDDLVLSRGIATGAAYSRTLVNVAERVSVPQSSWAMAGMADNFSAIDRRVRRALEGGHATSGWSRYGALAVLLLVAGWVLPGATDGAEKEFDAIEAAKVETAFRIKDMKSEHIGCNADGIPLRSGEIAFVVQSSTPEQPGLQVTATGEFLYPNAAGEAEKCVVTGEIKATYRDTSITASRIAFGKDGVVDFGSATLDTEEIKGLATERMVLDLRDGTFTMQNGNAEQVKMSLPQTAFAESKSAAQIKVVSLVVEIDRDADFTFPGGVKLAEFLKEGSPIVIVDGKEWSHLEESIQREIALDHAKILSSPSLIARGGEEATISIGAAVTEEAAAEVSDKELGISLSAVATLQESGDGVTGISLELEFTHASKGEPIDGKPVIDKSTVLLPGEGGWCYQVVFRSGERVDLLCVKAEAIRADAAE